MPIATHIIQSRQFGPAGKERVVERFYPTPYFSEDFSPPQLSFSLEALSGALIAEISRQRDEKGQADLEVAVMFATLAVFLSVAAFRAAPPIAAMTMEDGLSSRPSSGSDHDAVVYVSYAEPTPGTIEPPIIGPTRPPKQVSEPAPTVQSEKMVAVDQPKVEFEQLEGGVLIPGVPPVRQSRNLSCEAAVSVGACRFFGCQYQGREVDEGTFLDLYGHSKNPNKGFRGDVNAAPSLRNYGIHARPVAEALEAVGLETEEIYGGGMDELRQHIKDGHLVIAWIASRSFVEVEIEREEVKMALGEHTILLVGFDQKGFWANDPKDGRLKHYSGEVFEQHWGYLDNMAVIVKGRL